MENVPDRLLQVHNHALDKDQQPKVEVSKFSTQNDAYEFVIPHIDHSLGYIIKYELEQVTQVQFVSLKFPHPLEQKMIIRVHMNQPDTQCKKTFHDCVNKAIEHLKQLKTQILETPIQ